MNQHMHVPLRKLSHAYIRGQVLRRVWHYYRCEDDTVVRVWWYRVHVGAAWIMMYMNVHMKMMLSSTHQNRMTYTHACLPMQYVRMCMHLSSPTGVPRNSCDIYMHKLTITCIHIYSQCPAANLILTYLNKCMHKWTMNMYTHRVLSLVRPSSKFGGKERSILFSRVLYVCVCTYVYMYM